MVLGRIEVNDRCDTVDVDATSCDIGSHQSVNPAIAEVGKCAGALGLTAASVNGCRLEAFLAQLTCEPVRSVACTTEDDRRPGGTDSFSGDLAPVGLSGFPEDVAGSCDVGRFLADLVVDRILLIVAGELGDVSVEGGREENSLAVRVGLVEQAAHSGHEAHVGHPVGLIQHHPVYVGEGEGSLLYQVLETTGACNENVDTVPEGVQLGAVANTTVNDADLHLAGEGPEFG